LDSVSSSLGADPPPRPPARRRSVSLERGADLELVAGAFRGAGTPRSPLSLRPSSAGRL